MISFSYWIHLYIAEFANVAFKFDREIDHHRRHSAAQLSKGK